MISKYNKENKLKVLIVFNFLYDPILSVDAMMNSQNACYTFLFNDINFTHKNFYKLHKKKFNFLELFYITQNNTENINYFMKF